MKAQADKTGTEKSKAVAHTSSAAVHEAEESEVLFEDKRPEAVAQRQLADKADQGPQAGKIAQLQAMANTASAEPIQRLELEGEGDGELPDDEPESVQRVAKEKEVQTKSAVAQKKDAQTPNNTGLPDTLKSGIENLSGLAMDDVKVHYNSAKPAQLRAHAFAQGTDIHMAPGQEKHLPHEAWHVVQQKQGRVKPTKQMKGKVNVNDDAGLEKEADVMGDEALQLNGSEKTGPLNRTPTDSMESVIQRRIIYQNGAPITHEDLAEVLSVLNDDFRQQWWFEMASEDEEWDLEQAMINVGVGESEVGITGPAAAPVGAAHPIGGGGAVPPVAAPQQPAGPVVAAPQQPARRHPPRSNIVTISRPVRAVLAPAVEVC
jgi:hypothetical protein